MTAAEFEALLDRRLAETRRVLGAKAGEYATCADRLHNFKRAGELTGRGPADALLGMLAKHWVSVQDMVRARARGESWPGPDRIDEKVGDAVNYLILLEAVLREADGR